MRAKISLVVFVSVFLAVIAFAPQSQAQNWDITARGDVLGGGSGQLGIGQQIAGAWLGNPAFGFDNGEGDLWCDGVADTPLGDPATDVQSFSAGGLYVAVNPGNPNSGLGTWKKTGARQVSVTGHRVHQHHHRIPLPPMPRISCRRGW